MGRRHFYTAMAVDRAAHRRRDPSWVTARLQDRRTRFVPVRDRDNLVRSGESPVAGFPRGERLHETVGVDPASLLPDATGDRDDAPATLPIFLGIFDGEVYFAIDVPTGVGPDTDGGWRYRDLRRHGPLLEATEAGLLAYARAMVHWHATHRYCGSCGAATAVRQAGHLLVCSRESCGRHHFPRTDPAVIVRVLHDDRILLARQSSWPEDRRSVLAGFVEPGESLEDAVHREVHEEAGVRLREARYLGSQPWPFPASLMLGFAAGAEDDRLEPTDDELVDLAWWSRSRIREALCSRTLRLPPRASISRHLIEGWLDPDDGTDRQPW